MPLTNPGFEGSIASAGQPEGWVTIQHAGDVSYLFTPDHDAPRSGERSLRVDNVGPEPYGAVYQIVDAAPYRGRTLAFSAWMKTKETKGNRFGKGAGLKLQAMKNGYPDAVKQMRRDAIGGTTDWTRYELELDRARRRAADRGRHEPVRAGHRLARRRRARGLPAPR